MIRKEFAWKAKTSYENGKSEIFLIDDKEYSHLIGKSLGYLNAKTYTFRDAYLAVTKIIKSKAKNIQVWPVEIQYDTKTKQVKELPKQSGLDENLQADSYLLGKTNVERGKLFEDYIEVMLQKMFTEVRRNVWTQGRSGQIWQIDFLVGNKLVMEASTEKRSEIKVNTTFLKFIDLKEILQDHKFALLLASSYKKVYGQKGMVKQDRIIPLSPHKTFLSHNFAIMLVSDIKNLMSFYQGKLDALHCSSILSRDI